MGKRAWNSGFNGGMGKRAWNSGFTGQSLNQWISQNPNLDTAYESKLCIVYNSGNCKKLCQIKLEKIFEQN